MKMEVEHIGGVFSIFIREEKFSYSIVFGFGGFKKFVIDNDRNVLNKIMYGIKKFQKRPKNHFNFYKIFDERI